MLLLCSCDGIKVSWRLKQVMKTTITLPDSVTCIYNEALSSMPDSVRWKPKLIVYVDSAECRSCRLSKLPVYKSIAQEADRSNAFSLIVLFSLPQGNRDYQIDLLRYSSLDFPIYVDDLNEFSRKNPILVSDKRFHSVLVNSKGKPLLVGDPLRGGRLSKLFNNIVLNL